LGIETPFEKGSRRLGIEEGERLCRWRWLQKIVRCSAKELIREENILRISRMPVVRALMTAFILGCCTAVWATVPHGWYLAGNKPMDYEAGVDAQTAHNGHSSAYLKGKKPVIDGFDTLMRDFERITTPDKDCDSALS